MPVIAILALFRCCAGLSQLWLLNQALSSAAAAFTLPRGCTTEQEGLQGELSVGRGVAPVGCGNRPEPGQFLSASSTLPRE